jgi:hypothetical protein
MAMALWPSTAEAQRRVYRPHVRRSVFIGVGVGYSRPLYYRPYFGAFYSPFYSPFWYPFYAQYPVYPGYYGRGWASARIDVKPRSARVFLDGYYVGVVDQFDGIFQRLELPAGEHELTVYLPGYRTYRQKTLFRPGEGYGFKAILEPLPPGTPDEPAPTPTSTPDPYTRAADPYGARDPYREPQDPDRPRDPGRTVPLPDREPGEARPDAAGFGTLNLRVQPGDAVVTIDGERWDSPEGGARLSVQLSSGSHRVEVRKDGFRTYTSTIEIRAGEAQSLNVSLSR